MHFLAKHSKRVLFHCLNVSDQVWNLKSGEIYSLNWFNSLKCLHLKPFSQIVCTRTQRSGRRGMWRHAAAFPEEMPLRVRWCVCLHVCVTWLAHRRLKGEQTFLILHLVKWWQSSERLWSNCQRKPFKSFEPKYQTSFYGFSLSGWIRCCRSGFPL